MRPIDWPLTVKILAIWVIVAVIATPLIGRLLKNLRTHEEFRELHGTTLRIIRERRSHNTRIPAFELLEASRRDLASQEERELNQDTSPRPAA